MLENERTLAKWRNSDARKKRAPRKTVTKAISFFKASKTKSYAFLGASVQFVGYRYIVTPAKAGVQK